MLQKITRRKIQITLGLVWLLDGALQLQRQMFTSNFANKVLLPVSLGHPRIVSSPMHFEIRLILSHPALWDGLFALVQLTLGVLILVKKTNKVGLIASVFWALGVWSLGEGLAGMLSWHSTLFMGLPGAALIYAILALAVLPNKDNNKPAYWLPIIWASLWILGTIYLLLPGQNSPADSSQMLSRMTSGAPRWISFLDEHSAAMIGHMGFWFVAVVAIIQIIVGLFVFFPNNYRKSAIYVGIGASVIYWVLGQQLGGYFTGVATDPNSGPLFILLGVAILGSDWLPMKQLWKKIKNDVSKILI